MDSYHSPIVLNCTKKVAIRAKYNGLMIYNILCSRLHVAAVLGFDSVTVPVTTEYVQVISITFEIQNQDGRS